jgi:hypothetical protein
MQRRYDDLLQIIERCNDLPVYIGMVEGAAYALLGQMEKARTAVAAFRRITEPKPDERVYATYHPRMCARQEDRDHWLEGYRKAGLDV